MSSVSFICDICKISYGSQRGLKSHMTRSHNETNPSNVCGKCNRQLSSRNNREKHEKKCNALVTEETVKVIVEKAIKEQQLQVQPQQIINHITNITNNNNGDTNHYNNNGTYTQTNNILTSSLDNLKPITNRGIVEQMKQMFAEVTQERKLLLTSKDLGEKISSNVFRGSLMTTDASRGVMHWKDGDDNNKPIKDLSCAILSTKMYNALLDKKDEVTASYVEYIDSLTNNIDENTGEERCLDFHNSRKLISSLDNEDTMKHIGKFISKTPVIPKLKQIYKLEKFLNVLKEFFYEKPYAFMFQDSNGVGVSIKKALETYGNFTINEDEINLVDDDKKKIKIQKFSFFEIIKECFNSIPNNIFIFYEHHHLDFPKNFETIKIYVESKDTARNNSKSYQKWLHDELNESEETTYEKNILRMLRLKH